MTYKGETLFELDEDGYYILSYIMLYYIILYYIKQPQTNNNWSCF